MHTTRRQFVRVLGMSGLAGAAASLAACDAAWDDLARAMDSGEDHDFRAPHAGEIDEVGHVLNRITFGPRPEDRAYVERIGIDAYIDEQLHPASIQESRRSSWRINGIESIAKPRAELFEHHPAELLANLTRARLVRAVYSRRQLYEVMVEFWTDHFNIAAAKGQCRWLKAADDRDVVRAHALGNFSAMVRASALSPAMLIYLDGYDNKVMSPGDRPNENYARELLELHTMGADGGYTQRDVIEVARCLSGWTYGHSLLQPDRVRFDSGRHDNGEKVVLGERIPAGGGAEDLDRVIEIVCGHPSTARFVAHRLCRKFIAERPEDDVVAAVAGAFVASDGDIRITLRALLRHEAFRAGNRGNLFKRPVRFIVSALRAVDAVSDCGSAVMQPIERMGHAPFQYPTPDGYPLESEPWLGTLLWRWNFALDLERGRVAGTELDRDVLKARFETNEALAAHVIGRRLDDEERSTLAASDAPLALLLSSPAFQMH